MSKGYPSFYGNTRGVSLIELLVASGILALVAAGVAAGIFSVISSQSAITHRMDGTEFVGSLARSLTEKTACHSFLNGKQVNMGTNWVPLRIENYRGFGDKIGVPLEAGYVVSGTAGSPTLRVAGLFWRIKPNSSAVDFAETVRRPDGTVQVTHLIKTQMQLRVELEVRDPRVNRMEKLPVRYVEFMVVRRADNNVITACEGTPSFTDNCAVLGTKADANMTNCMPDGQSCQLSGSYARSWCDRYDYRCRAQEQVPNRVNPFTNGYSCPSGSTPAASFVHSWVSEEKAGKKWSVPVTNYVEVYICITCR